MTGDRLSAKKKHYGNLASLEVLKKLKKRQSGQKRTHSRARCGSFILSFRKHKCLGAPRNVQKELKPALQLQLSVKKVETELLAQ